MGRGFAEVAYFRGNDEKYEENFSQIDWSSTKKDQQEDEVKKSEEKKVTKKKAIWKMEKVLIGVYENMEEFEGDLKTLIDLKDDSAEYIGEDYEWF